MMHFRVKINCDNDAFRASPENETARLLEKLADEIKAGSTFGTMRDGNGNTVGYYEFTFEGNKTIYGWKGE